MKVLSICCGSLVIGGAVWKLLLLAFSLAPYIFCPLLSQSNATSPVNGTDANSTKTSDSEPIKVEVNSDASDSAAAEDSAAPTIEEQEGDVKNEEL